MDFPFDNVTITGGFWAGMQKKNREVTIPAVYERFRETGRVAALACRWKEGDPDCPHIFWDSDIAKWIEGAAYVLAKHPDPELEALVESMIDDIEANQWEDGYINSHYTCVESENRFTDRDCHELYTAGHLIEAAVAYYYATGRDRFLHCVERFADLIDRLFRQEGSVPFVTPGHEEIELALLRLYRCTGNEKYKDLSAFFIDRRGNNDKEASLHDAAYSQSEKPVREMTSALGHAVRAGYLYTAMADMAGITKEKALFDAARRLYDDIVNGKMYITGGVGSTPLGEAFTVPYDLPNETGYAETCAAIAFMFFSQKLLEIEGERRYADTVERILYNGFLSGLSLSGDAFYYQNPLSLLLRNRVKNSSTEDSEWYPILERQKVFGCSCCPPNVNRVLGSIERYVSRTDGDTVYLDQYMEGEVTGDGFSVTVKTDYPVSGGIRIVCRGVGRLALRIPGWCRSFTLSAPYRTEKGYAMIEKPDEVTLTLDMTPVVVTAHPDVTDCAGRGAVQRGPVVYALEGIDNGRFAPDRFRLARELNAAVGDASLFGVPTLTVDGVFLPGRETLYAPVEEQKTEKTRIRLIPYFAFANRGKTDMAVWILLA